MNKFKPDIYSPVEYESGKWGIEVSWYPHLRITDWYEFDTEEEALESFNTLKEIFEDVDS